MLELALLPLSVLSAEPETLTAPRCYRRYGMLVCPEPADRQAQAFGPRVLNAPVNSVERETARTTMTASADVVAPKPVAAPIPAPAEGQAPKSATVVATQKADVEKPEMPTSMMPKVPGIEGKITASITGMAAPNIDASEESGDAIDAAEAALSDLSGPAPAATGEPMSLYPFEPSAKEPSTDRVVGTAAVSTSITTAVIAGRPAPAITLREVSADETAETSPAN